MYTYIRNLTKEAPFEEIVSFFFGSLTDMIRVLVLAIAPSLRTNETPVYQGAEDTA